MQIDIEISRPDPLNPEVMRRAIVRGVTRIMFLSLRRAIVNVSGRLVKVQRGRLRTSLRAEVTQPGPDVKGTLEANAAHAKPLEEGARPHIIRARRAKALRLATTSIRGARLVQTRRGLVRAGGRQVTTSIRFARFVRHPGNAPRLFLSSALRDTLPEMPTILLAEISAALGETA